MWTSDSTTSDSTTSDSNYRHSVEEIDVIAIVDWTSDWNSGSMTSESKNDSTLVTQCIATV